MGVTCAMLTMVILVVVPGRGAGGLKCGYVSYVCQHAGRWCFLKLGAAIVGSCFDVFLGSLTVIAAVQLCEPMTVDSCGWFLY